MASSAATDVALLREERITEVLRLRRSGLDYREIEAKTGIPRTTANLWVRNALREARTERSAEAALHRAESVERLEALLAAVWDKATAGSVAHVDQARKIISDIGDLTGAKAPIKYEIGEADVDRLLADVQRAIDLRTGSIAGEVAAGSVEDPGVEGPDPG